MKNEQEKKENLDRVMENTGLLMFSLKNGIIKYEDIINRLLAGEIYTIALKLDNAPIEKLADAVIKTGDAEYIYKFARDVKNAPIEKLTDAVIKTGDAGYIYIFARDVKNVPIEKLAYAVIKTGDAKYIYKFARDVKGASIEKLTDAIIKTGNGKYIYYFAVRCIAKEDLVSFLTKVKNSDMGIAPLYNYINQMIDNLREQNIYYTIGFNDVRVIVAIYDFVLNFEYQEEESFFYTNTNSFEYLMSFVWRDNKKNYLEMFQTTITNASLLETLLEKFKEVVQNEKRKKDKRYINNKRINASKLFLEFENLYYKNPGEILERKEEFAYLFNDLDEIHKR